MCSMHIIRFRRCILRVVFGPEINFIIIIGQHWLIQWHHESISLFDILLVLKIIHLYIYFRLQYELCVLFRRKYLFRLWKSQGLSQLSCVVKGVVILEVIWGLLERIILMVVWALSQVNGRNSRQFLSISLWSIDFPILISLFLL